MCAAFSDEWDPQPILDAAPEDICAFWKQKLWLLVGNPMPQEGVSVVQLFPPPLPE